jgi:NADH pyrophosphatase NudC (nudix superfamily)
MIKYCYCPVCSSNLVMRNEFEPQRLACPSENCTFVHWNNPIPVVAAILEYKGEVILARKQGWPENWYGLITGFLEAGETPEEAILREVEEEVGLKGKIIEFVGYYSFFEKNELILAYHVKGQGTIILGDELEASKNISISKLRPWAFGTGLAVKDWLNARES